MARFKNKANGVVIDVGEDTAKTLGAEWQSESKPRSRSRKADDTEE